MFDADVIYAMRRLGVDASDLTDGLAYYRAAGHLAAVAKVTESAERLMEHVRKQEEATARLLEVVGNMVVAIKTYCYNHCDHERGVHAPNCPAADMGWPVCKELTKEEGDEKAS